MSIMITPVKIETNLEMYIWKLEDAYCKRTHSKKIAVWRVILNIWLIRGKNGPTKNIVTYLYNT